MNVTQLPVGFLSILVSFFFRGMLFLSSFISSVLKEGYWVYNFFCVESIEQRGGGDGEEKRFFGMH